MCYRVVERMITINKPFTVAYEDFKSDLADLINNSGLPALVIEYVLRDYANETKIAAARQYQLDKAKYESAENSTAE